MDSERVKPFGFRPQYEKWLAPVLATGPQTDWTSSVGIAFYPKSWSFK